ncbi:hypothetical protein VTL71DRAFT_15319 [Oculimacula yallundae]|uniref:Uncharacterized protein n=1 Tax=Oculimacula yallundae TaxID=86028 RepID=A0ABR4CG80_9HELO
MRASSSNLFKLRTPLLLSCHCQLGVGICCLAASLVIELEGLRRSLPQYPAIAAANRPGKRPCDIGVQVTGCIQYEVFQIASWLQKDAVQTSRKIPYTPSVVRPSQDGLGVCTVILCRDKAWDSTVMSRPVSLAKAKKPNERSGEVITAGGRNRETRSLCCVSSYGAPKVTQALDYGVLWDLNHIKLVLRSTTTDERGTGIYCTRLKYSSAKAFEIARNPKDRKQMSLRN